MNITDDYDATPTAITIPMTDIAASTDFISITIPPHTSISSWPLMEPSPDAPKPRQQASAREKAKKSKRRKQAKLSKRRNR